MAYALRQAWLPERAGGQPAPAAGEPSQGKALMTGRG